MPSSEHAILVDLFRARPSLAPTLLGYLGFALRDAPEPEIVDSTFPATVADRHADLVLLVPGSGGKPRLVIVVEVQLGKDPDKPRRWLQYHVALEERHRCDVVVLVVTDDAKVAAWAAEPVAVGPHGRFAPAVLGPEQVPRLLSVREEERTPELAVLSAMAHRSEMGEVELRAAAKVLFAGVGDRASLYFDWLLATFGDALSRAVEDVMYEGEPLSDWGKSHYWRGVKDGKAEGIAEGESRGEAKGLAEALLRMLEGRGLTVSPAQRAKLLGCTDVGLLGCWIDGALEARSVEDLFGEK